MRVRMLIGPNAGETVDLIYHAARTLVEAGQAEDIDNQMQLSKPKVARLDDIVIESKPDVVRTVPAEIVEMPHKKKRK